MISRLRGVILERTPPQLVIEVGGVGYEVELPLSSFAELAVMGEVVLFTQLIVREDAHSLYGFTSPARRAWFRRLLRVNGIGPRVALALLSALDDGQLSQAVASEDIARLTQVPGIGRKTAERLFVELRGKVPEVTRSPVTAADEALGALLSLGYRPHEAQSAVERARRALGPEARGEELIRIALQGMVR
ncbi:MAG: Holliday junction branch migration protein RuvA [Acidiferrobacter sp.]